MAKAPASLILIGIFGAVFAARPGRHPDRRDREARAAIAEAPPSIESDLLEPLAESFGKAEIDSAGTDGDHAGRENGGLS